MVSKTYAINGDIYLQLTFKNNRLVSSKCANGTILVNKALQKVNDNELSACGFISDF